MNQLNAWIRVQIRPLTVIIVIIGVFVFEHKQQASSKNVTNKNEKGSLKDGTVKLSWWESISGMDLRHGWCFLVLIKSLQHHKLIVEDIEQNTQLQWLTMEDSWLILLHSAMKLNSWKIIRFRMVKIWFPQNTIFSWFFTGRAFIMVSYIIKLVLTFQFDLQNPLKQPKMWILEKWKIIGFGQNYGIFWPKGDLKQCIMMYFGYIHFMSLVPVNFRNFYSQILQKWPIFG